MPEFAKTSLYCGDCGYVLDSADVHGYVKGKYCPKCLGDNILDAGTVPQVTIPEEAE